MATTRFCRYDLRTTDVAAARAFYRALFGARFWDSNVRVLELPRAAAARGAPAHWLGQLGAADFADTLARIALAGGALLSPEQRAEDGSSRAVLRDPSGAIFGVESAAEIATESAVTWHLHHSDDEARAFDWYRTEFGWHALAALELGAHGKHQLFAWRESEPTAGSFVDGVRSLRAHPQWLFFFSVADLNTAIAQVRTLGGLALDPVETPEGDRVVACDDAQGAAFGLYQRR